MQMKTQLIHKILASGFLGIALTAQSQQFVNAQERSTFLLNMDCVNTGIGNWRRQDENIVVNKAVYLSRFYMGSGDTQASFTCRLEPHEENISFETLRLGFGMRDNDTRSPNVRVKVYIDGVEVKSETVQPGKPPVVLSLSLTNPQNISLEAECSSKFQYCDRVYFWDASLGIAP